MLCVEINFTLEKNKLWRENRFLEAKEKNNLHLERRKRKENHEYLWKKNKYNNWSYTFWIKNKSDQRKIYYIPMRRSTIPKVKVKLRLVHKLKARHLLFLLNMRCLRDCWHTVILCMAPRPQISTVVYEGICARVGECALESLNLHSHLPWVCPSYIFAVHYWSSKFKLILTSLFEDDNNSIFGSVTSLWTTMSVCLSVCPFVQKKIVLIFIRY